ncbi:MAG: TldD/PmbA family protein [Defluviitaleaceae bacterium]|nr:TldD/PmbA family protein [Defluviitaleaceae bacterium]MCL2835781.1 TldD/PmbA family protein [Defluviitaleaceae bacterium]
MQYNFPKGLYVDVRIEHLFSTRIRYTLKTLDECKERQYSAAFIRAYDGIRWYYASTSDLTSVQAEIDGLAKLAANNVGLEDMPVFKNFSDKKDKKLVFTGHEVSNVPLQEKVSLLESLMPLVEKNAYIKIWMLNYLDEYKVKEFYNSKGAELTWDFQRAGLSTGFQMAEGERQMRESYQIGKTRFNELKDFEEGITKLIKECEEFLLESEAVEPGIYPVLMSHVPTGVFVHECFGHKSESDFMIGDEATRKEWALGKKVGPEDLTIVESGLVEGNGYVIYDDEGNAATTTYLIKNGILTGRLHSAASAADLGEDVTGNARAMDFEHEPLVRMTTTYIENGAKTLDQLISETENGIYVKGVIHGSGMSTFTLAPSLAYYIKDGKIGKPVRISVISGNVFEALENIDGIANDLTMGSFVTGGCGKMAQFPLSVGFGGPHIRVKNMQVQ